MNEKKSSLRLGLFDGGNQDARNTTSSVYQPDLLVVAMPKRVVEIPNEAALIAECCAPVSASAAVGFAAKEAKIRSMLAELSVAQSRQLHARLTAQAGNDALVAAFAKLAGERRARLMAFVADARRREALSVRKAA